MSKYSENIRRNFEPSCYDLYFVTEYFSLNLVISIVQKYFINFESKVLREIQVFFQISNPISLSNKKFYLNRPVVGTQHILCVKSFVFDLSG